MEVMLPGSDDTESPEPAFGVPVNLDIFGTMNTADRSIALLDVALRRRFAFREMEPNYELLPRSLSGIDLSALLRRVNARLEFLLDRDHRIGHAYLMHATSLDDLQQVFRLQIIPLLQEYFFDDLARVAAVLETSVDVPPFVTRQPLNYANLFSGARPENTPSDRATYVVTPASTWTDRTFIGVYAEDSEPGDGDQD
jgi:5-methylcytosine-specific restriction protein B